MYLKQHKIYSNLILILFIFIFTACKSTEKRSGNENLVENANLIKFEKTPCFGFCPVFTLLIESNGNAFYHAKSNLDTSGEFTAKLTTEELNALNELIELADFKNMEKKYPHDREIPADLPAKAITFYSKSGEPKRIMNYGHGAPSELVRLEEYLENLRKSKSWE